MEAQKLWNFFSHTYPKIQAFDYSGGCEILTIKPQDIGLLPRETWVYGNNSFLLHGYYNHRYLVLARLNTPKGKPRFLIGVPGHYYNNEKYMASMVRIPGISFSPRCSQPETAASVTGIPISVLTERNTYRIIERNHLSFPERKLQSCIGLIRKLRCQVMEWIFARNDEGIESLQFQKKME